jgi:hypothetical protein
MIPANKYSSSILIWGVIQIALLGICASEIPFWLHHPFPRESVAIQVLWCGQLLSTAMLFPTLFRNSSAMIISLAMMACMDELAGLLSNCTQLILVKGFICVGAWMIGLAGLTWIVKDVRYQLSISTLAMLLTAGGAVLDYLRWEVQSTSTAPTPFHPISLLPKLCAVATSNSAMPWQWASVPLAGLLVMAAYRRLTSPASTSLHTAD